MSVDVAPDVAATTDGDTPLLEVDHLFVKFFTRRGIVHAVRDVSFNVARGETLGLVGESGSGKSVTAQALMGLIDLPGKITSGDVRWKGNSLVTDAEATLRRVRGREIAMVFQDPMTSLNPLFTVGAQIAEVLRRHLGMSKREAQQRAAELLDLVGIANPGARVDQYPHEMSGGMRQRVLIAMSLACEPELLIADEPTTALDVTIQAQILDLLSELQRERNMALILITHDMGVVAETAERVKVMYAGQEMEGQSAAGLFSAPRHPYTGALLDALPDRNRAKERLATIPGVVPGIEDRPVGCLFSPRCPKVQQNCREVRPELTEDHGRWVRCFYPLVEGERLP